MVDIAAGFGVAATREPKAASVCCFFSFFIFFTYLETRRVATMNTLKFIFSVTLLLVGPWASAQQLGSACALTGAEVSAALGATFDEGKPGLEIPGAAMVMRDCRYKSKNLSLMLKTTHYTAAADATAALKLLAGTLRAVPKDPDGAVIQENQGDATSPVVHYARHGVAVELRVLGIYYKDLQTKATDLKRLQDKLLTLRRIP